MKLLFKYCNCLFICLSIVFTNNVNANFDVIKKDTLKVLFVGNSFSFYYNLPQVVSAMSKYNENTYIDTRHSLVSGSTLFDHLNQKRGSQTLKILNEQNFDYVVVNHHSLATIENLDSFFNLSKQSVELVRSKNSVPVFMETWQYLNKPQMLDIISPAYKKMGKQLSVDIVPCGQLFSKAIEQNNLSINLYEDIKHPSKEGTYLNALAFYKYFTNGKTNKISKRITTIDQNGQKLYLLLLSKKNADFLQSVVDNYDFKTLN